MNVFQAIKFAGHDEDFDGDPTNQRFFPTDAAPGSVRKIEVLRYRALHGCPLWHPEDQKNCDAETQRTKQANHKDEAIRTINDHYKMRKGLGES